MEAFRQIVDIENHTLSIVLPNEFNIGKVEVIVLPIGEEEKAKKQKPSDFRGAISKDVAITILKEIAESRKKWERDI